MKTLDILIVSLASLIATAVIVGGIVIYDKNRVHAINHCIQQTHVVSECIWIAKLNLLLV